MNYFYSGTRRTTSLALMSTLMVSSWTQAQPLDPGEPPTATEDSDRFEQEPSGWEVDSAPPAEEAPPAVDATKPASVQPQAPTPEAVQSSSDEVELPEPSPEEIPSPSPWPLQVTTSTFSRFEYREGYERLGVSRGRFVEGDMTVYRTRLGVRTNPLPVTDGVEALVQFSPQVSGQYGKTGTIAEQNVGLYEGYLRVQGSALSFDLGRFMMNYGDAMIIGNLDWHQTGRSFEGARSRLTLEKGWVDFFVTQTLRPNPLPGETVAEGHPTYNEPLFAGDTYFWGMYSALGNYVKEGMDLELYLLGLSSSRTRGVPVDPEDASAGTFTRAAATDLTLGTRLKDNLTEFLDYRVEAGIQTGTRPNPADGGSTVRTSRAYQVDGELGVRPIGPLRVSFGGQIASGDDPETEADEGWLDLYPTGHKFLGLMDVTGARTNIWSVIGKAQVKLRQGTVFNVDVHYFNRLYTPEGLENTLGTEINGYLIHKLGGPLGCRVLYGAFLPNTGHYGTDQVAHYGEAELALVF